MTYDEEAPVLRVREKVVLTVRDEEGLRCGEVSVGAAIPDDGGPRLASVNFSSPSLGGEPPREVVGMIMRPEQPTGASRRAPAGGRPYRGWRRRVDGRLEGGGRR
jgi:hypothetical protein